MKMYDYLIVGSGLYGAIFAYEMKKRGHSVLVVERRDHIGGNIYCETKEGIPIHKYGAHIFHTSNEAVWKYVNQFVSFNHFVNAPVANYKGTIYNLPFNMNTFARMWNMRYPDEARTKIEEQRQELAGRMPQNLEEQAISLVGRDIYERLIKGYTEKQWGRSCKDLPAFIIKRLPVRYTYDNNYFNDTYQGIPKEGYTALIERLLDSIEVRLHTDFLADKEAFKAMAKRIVYTGSIDAYFDYRLGQLAYRGLRFETKRLDKENYQGVAVMNFTEGSVPYTRIIEHKHFIFGQQPVTYITREYPVDWHRGDEAYYPVNDAKNQALYEQYKGLADKEDGLIFGGRLGEYKYYDMDKVIESALGTVERESRR